MVMNKFCQRFVLIVAVALVVWGCTSKEYRDTKQIVHIVVENDLSSHTYIRQFHKIEHAQNLQQLQQATEETLSVFQQAQRQFQLLSVSSKEAQDVLKEYERGVLSLQNYLHQIKQSRNPQQLAYFKKQLKKSEQILLNAREKLFNLAMKYNLDILLKTGSF